MNDEQMQPILDTFYRDREIARPKVQTGVASVMTQVPQTRQHSRRWPFPVFYRKTETPTATDTTDYLPTSIPATNGHSATVLVRTKSIFSPAKAITAGALVFAIGGVLLVTQPFDQQGSVPGATGDAGVFSPAGSFGTINHTATLLPDGRVLIVGGRGDDPVPGAAHVWDPVTASFGPAGRLDVARRDHSATLLPDGRVLVVGGWNGAVVEVAEVWDPATASFSPAGRYAVRTEDGHTATLLPDGRVLVTQAHSDLAEVWDPATESFDPADSLDVARQSDAVGSLEVGRYGHTTTLLPDGRVLVVGGEELIEGAAPVSIGPDPAIPVATAIVWDPVTASFAPAGSLDGTRAGHTATLLPDGRVLIVGGEDGLRDFDCRYNAFSVCPEHLVREAEVWEPSDG